MCMHVSSAADDQHVHVDVCIECIGRIERVACTCMYLCLHKYTYIQNYNTCMYRHIALCGICMHCIYVCRFIPQMHAIQHDVLATYTYALAGCCQQEALLLCLTPLCNAGVREKWGHERWGISGRAGAANSQGSPHPSHRTDPQAREVCHVSSLSLLFAFPECISSVPTDLERVGSHDFVQLFVKDEVVLYGKETLQNFETGVGIARESEKENEWLKARPGDGRTAL